MSLRVVGLQLREVETGPVHKDRHTIERAYVVLAYGDETIGKLAISKNVFDRMRGDGIPLLTRPIARK